MNAAALAERYRRDLLEDTLPFWLRHAVDRERGGFLFCLDRDGTVLDTDKPMWLHGRFTWLLATLFREVREEEAWLDLARHGLAFLERHGFREDGGMWFLVDRDGRPLRARRYVFTECFAATARAAVARATGDEALGAGALDLFRAARTRLRTPGAIPPKVEAATRPQKGLGAPMIELWCARELSGCGDDAWLDEVTRAAADEIARDFVHAELDAVLEVVGPDGEFLDTLEGRQLNPGHALECGWFLLDEAARTGDAKLRDVGLDVLDRAWRSGWDEEHGGVLSFVDVRGGPPPEVHHDMKFWWPQCEALVGALAAYAETGDEVWAARHAAVHDWAHAHHADPEHGEWFGYLHRDGSVASPVKGGHWKGPFHVPRMQLEAARRCAALAGG